MMIVQIEGKKLKNKSNLALDDMLSVLNDGIPPDKMIHPIGYVYSNGVKYMFKIVAKTRFEKFKIGDRVEHIKYGAGTCKEFEQEGEKSCYMPNGLISVIFDRDIPKNRKHFYVEEVNISLIKKETNNANKNINIFSC